MTKHFKTVVWIFILLTGSMAGISLLLIDRAVNSFFHPEVIAENFTPEHPNDLPMKTIQLNYKNFSLDAWYLQAEGAEYAVLVCHDATGNLYSRIPLYRLWHELGISVLTFDYRGFGKSGGEEPTFEDYATDMKRGYEKLKLQLKNKEKLILYGQGIFVSEMLELAVNKGCDGIIVENAVPALGRLYTDPIRTFLLRDHFNLTHKMDRIACPILFIHGSDNPRVSPEIITSVQSELSRRSTLCVIDGAGYGELAETHPEAWKKCVTDFITEIDKAIDLKSINL